MRPKITQTTHVCVFCCVNVLFFPFFPILPPITAPWRINNEVPHLANRCADDGVNHDQRAHVAIFIFSSFQKNTEKTHSKWQHQIRNIRKQTSAAKWQKKKEDTQYQTQRQGQNEQSNNYW